MFAYKPDDPFSHSLLKEKQRELRDTFPMPLTMRLHRGLSWLGRSERELADSDVRFVLLWIGFNALYAGNIDQALSNEREVFREFFSTLVRLDNRHSIYDTVWERFPQEIRTLLANKYVFGPFWKFQNGENEAENWELHFKGGQRAVNKALSRHDTPTILSIVFDRLYVLRNQLVHGGATWDSSVNRSQVNDGASILACLLPIFLDLMMDHPEQAWSMPHYPPVD